MPKKIFTAPAPSMTLIADRINELELKATLGAPDPEDEDGVVVWIETDDADDAAELIVLAAEAWERHQS
jgi:hypothetical protein